MSKERLNGLLAQREALEVEADCIAQHLKSPGPNGEPPAGLKDSLVDSEGFPRGDIDLFEVRAKRHRLAIINTDYRHLMKEIETELSKIHASLLQTEANDSGSGHEDRPQLQTPSDSSVQHLMNSTVDDTSTKKPIQVIMIPIAAIDEILPDSPSAAAGLIDGDELLSIGTIDYRTTNPLSVIPKFVFDNENVALPVVIRRGGHVIMELELTPRRWSGRGLLGCHLSPV